jgi:hypothetical protein
LAAELNADPGAAAQLRNWPDTDTVTMQTANA